MTDTRLIIHEHQKATDTTDTQMLDIVCAFLDTLGKFDRRALEDYVVENLSRLPGDMSSTTPWDDTRFTDADRNLMVICVEEEIRDSTKDLAFEQLEKEPMVELIGYADPDPDGTVFAIQHLCNPEETRVDGEFLRSLPEDGDDYPRALDYAKRMGLINEAENEVTPLGMEFIGRWS